eukprot:3351437-Rhodomonas_salina.1
MVLPDTSLEASGSSERFLGSWEARAAKGHMWEQEDFLGLREDRHAPRCWPMRCSHLTVLVHVRATRCPGLTLRMVVPARRIRAISSTMRARDAGQRRTTNSDGKS